MKSKQIMLDFILFGVPFIWFLLGSETQNGKSIRVLFQIRLFLNYVEFLINIKFLIMLTISASLFQLKSLFKFNIINISTLQQLEIILWKFNQ